MIVGLAGDSQDRYQGRLGPSIQSTTLLPACRLFFTAIGSSFISVWRVVIYARTNTIPELVITASGQRISAAFLNRFNFVYLTSIYAWARLNPPTSGDLVAGHALHCSEDRLSRFPEQDCESRSRGDP